MRDSPGVETTRRKVCGPAAVLSEQKEPARHTYWSKHKYHFGAGHRHQTLQMAAGWDSLACQTFVNAICQLSTRQCDIFGSIMIHYPQRKTQLSWSSACAWPVLLPSAALFYLKTFSPDPALGLGVSMESFKYADALHHPPPSVRAFKQSSSPPNVLLVDRSAKFSSCPMLEARSDVEILHIVTWLCRRLKANTDRKSQLHRAIAEAHFRQMMYGSAGCP